MDLNYKPPSVHKRKQRSLEEDSCSSEDLDDLCIDHELVDIDEIAAVAPHKPHFLDYDAVPPPGFDDGEIGGSTPFFTSKTPSLSSTNTPASVMIMIASSGEQLKIDKMYERDGEISDYELAASGVTKKETSVQRKNFCGVVRKKKHFLDENPIPPDYMINKEHREHRSLDRNFERQTELLIGSNQNLKTERKHSLDRDGASAMMSTSPKGRKVKEPSYTLSRFIESELFAEVSTSSASRGTWPIDEPQPDHETKYSSFPGENVQNLGPKVECVYSLLSMLGSHDSSEMSKKFLELSRTTDTCATLRRYGCIPLLVQMMHSDPDETARKRAAMALHNVVHFHPDDKAGRREAKVMRLTEQIMDYCSFLKTLLMSGGEAIADDADRHPLPAVSSLMKLSFDGDNRHDMCQLGTLQAIASLVHLDHAVHGPKPEDQCCNSLRRYALMALTNLTFGDGNNKALLCANKEFMEALVAQLEAAPDDLLQVTASVLRNLSWRADNNMKAVLNEIGTVTALTRAAMKNKNENTLKAILSALWNLSAHCSTNKAEFCTVDGALAFLVDMLTYEGPSKTLKIIENSGGILRNVSSHIAVREDYRRILRQRSCLGILLQQLKSESLTVVSNSCGTLWNLSARFPEDQKYLWDNGAVPMLRSLIHSKHKMISEGSSAALKNLLNFRPGSLHQNNLDPIAKQMGLKELPTLTARKQKALEQELNNHNLSETCENLDAVTPPKEKSFNASNIPCSDLEAGNSVTVAGRLTRSAVVSKSESRDSITSAKSDSIYEKVRRGNSAPPCTTVTSTSLVKDSSKSAGLFNTRNNFVESGFEVETETELPIDYSAKYNSESVSVPIAVIAKQSVPTIPVAAKPRKQDSRNYSAYQETDLDQITDYSLRYAENQVESDSDEKPEAASASEIILILEDSVKCYETEGTPYVISNAASVSDLRNATKIQHDSSQEPAVQHEKPQPVPRVRQRKHPQTDMVVNNYGAGIFTPEKPINYCEEGTPAGYFSRYESLSSLDESPPSCMSTSAVAASNDPSGVSLKSAETVGPLTKPENIRNEDGLGEEGPGEIKPPTPPLITSDSATTIKTGTFKVEKKKSDTTDLGPIISNMKAIGLGLSSAQETPLMFSRRSSMDSLASAEPITADDKSSVVSDFSRLASGIISPSELPDSPTQSMPQSPRRNSTAQAPFLNTGLSVSQSAPKSIPAQPRLRSVFEDEVNMFNVENTPAHYSCATSLSNLSIEDEPKIAGDSLVKDCENQSKEAPTPEANEADENNHRNSQDISGLISEGEDETANDDILLATCINIGMNRGASSSNLPHSALNIANKVTNSLKTAADDGLLQYFTEDTPAELSKVGSNSNLSSLSILSNKLESINLSDESSNASDGGGELFEQCIREGMQKTAVNSGHNGLNGRNGQQQPQTRVASSNDPIAMLRRGGLPPYLPVGDEMNRFNLEDSPCNFSVVSGLSDLTAGSVVAGLVRVKPLGSSGTSTAASNNPTANNDDRQDSMSSISIESEDDTNLFSQMIAAGVNKAKSKPSTPIPVEQSNSRSTRNTAVPRPGYHEASDSLSSVESSDSNDHQSRSLLEQCIRTGMKRERRVGKAVLSMARPHFPPTAPPLPFQNPLVSPRRSQLSLLNLNSNIRTPLKNDRDRQRDRERKDEELLMECINTGITKKIGSSSSSNDANLIRPPQRLSRHVLGPTEFNQRIISGGPSNNLLNTPSQHHQMHQLSMSKNDETTSVAVLDKQHMMEAIKYQDAPNTAPGVVKTNEDQATVSQANSSINNYRHQQQSKAVVGMVDKDCDRSQRLHEISSTDRIIGCDVVANREGETLHKSINSNQSFEQQLQQSYASLNLSSGGINPLERSNEYPALRNSADDIYVGDDSCNENSFEMEISNEFLIENDLEEETSTSLPKISDKHKDPDLMLKSVERLTQEFVSTAEHLRTASLRNNYGMNGPFESNESYEKKSGSNSNSNNTWNDDTCPNDVSFPSLSITAPIIASFNDDETTISEVIPIKLNDPDEVNEATPTNEVNGFVDSLNPAVTEIGSQPNSLETETDTLVNDETDGAVAPNKCSNVYPNSAGIKFKVGGEVDQRLHPPLGNFGSSGPMSFDATFSTMTCSTIIAMEADKLATQLMMNMTSSTASLDLDNVRPPSMMECLSMSGCYDIPQSPQLSRNRKKSLPLGLMAKRALGACQNQNTVMSCSVESVNSTCNLDNIKPPSLMDELLDSMISVASITSEIVDHSLGTTASNYETAFSDVDEMSTTLQSCDGGSLDYDSNGTPIPSDFSSAESTPRKNRGGGVKRTLTPKQKRRAIKDRFKTYTIAADFVLKENFPDDGPTGAACSSDCHHINNEDVYDEEEDEILKVEIEHIDQPQKLTRRLSSKEKRVEDRARYQTQSVDLNALKRNVIEIGLPISPGKRRSTDPDRFKTRTISFNGEQEDKTAFMENFARTNQFSDQQKNSMEAETSLFSTEDDEEEMSSIRALTKQFKYINDPDLSLMEIYVPTNISHLPKAFATVSKISGLDETRTTTESEYNSIDYDQNSETESCDLNQNKSDGDDSIPKMNGWKPRIIKPNDSGDSNFSEECLTPPPEQETVKAVRGRKKPVYISPYKQTVTSTTRNASSKPPHCNGIGGAAVVRSSSTTKMPSPENKKALGFKKVGKNQAIVANTHVIINAAYITNKISAAKSDLTKTAAFGSNVSRRNIIVEKNLINKKNNNEHSCLPSHSEASSPSSLERQGTFVKGEPSNTPMPTINSATSGKTSKLPKKSPAKLGALASKLKNTFQGTNSSTSTLAKGLPPKQNQFSARPATSETSKKRTFGLVRKSPSVPAVPQRSYSNASLRTTPKTSGLRTDLPSTTPPSRSNSNLAGRGAITSKISGIWKKCPDDKKTKPPIRAKSFTTKLIRSSTFDNLPSDSDKGQISSRSQLPKAQASPLSATLAEGKKEERRINPTENSATTATKRVSRLGTFITNSSDKRLPSTTIQTNLKTK